MYNLDHFKENNVVIFLLAVSKVVIDRNVPPNQTFYFAAELPHYQNFSKVFLKSNQSIFGYFRLENVLYLVSNSLSLNICMRMSILPLSLIAST